MTTLELFKKHRKGEVSRERFLYEVRRDNNLPWITNVTSYNDAVKILKNKGIIKEAYENVATDPAVDRVNPYYLKKGVQKSIADEKELKDDTYINHLNKAAKKLQSDPKAFHGEMFGNYDTVNKADSKLQMTPVKKDNFVDEDNGMKKLKGQEAPKAMSAPTKENRKGKPKDVKVMPDKGVEGSEKVIKEIASYIKKKLNENNSYNDFNEGMEVETAYGTGIVKEINGGTLTVETKDGKLIDVQMNHARHLMQKKKEGASTYAGGMKPYHDPTSQLTGTGKPNVTGPMPTDDLEDETDLQPGDLVKVVYGNQFYGMTGTIEDVMRGFVIVNIDGEDYSMHSSDVEKIGEEDYDMDYEEEIDESNYAGKGSIESFKKDPNYSNLDSATKQSMEKKLAAGGSVQI